MSEHNPDTTKGGLRISCSGVGSNLYKYTIYSGHKNTSGALHGLFCEESDARPVAYVAITAVTSVDDCFIRLSYSLLRPARFRLGC